MSRIMTNSESTMPEAATSRSLPVAKATRDGSQALQSNAKKEPIKARRQTHKKPSKKASSKASANAFKPADEHQLA
ncbi:Conserved hypothetical protein [Prochlorococcus marinus str. MIT 9303]|uniref:Uncharacterized protein n=1 Tax=Prochlorococcus marinus (strain MIT 9303) TaxID=59922 RepID=A2C6F3_PROM3|nr:Conserved hypothetical protein [Prochlorococcus marinus str. MIT 9303]